MNSRSHWISKPFRIVARFWARRRSWAKAAKAYRAYLKHVPDDSQAWIQFGHSLKELNEIGAACDAYRRASILSPDRPDALSHLGHALLLLGNRKQAIEAYVAAVDTDATFEPAVQALLSVGQRERLPAEVALREENAGRFANSRYAAYRAITQSRPVSEPQFDPTDGNAPSSPSSPAFVVAYDSETGSLSGDIPTEDAGWVLVHLRGTLLHKSCLGWLLAAISDATTTAAYCDYELGSTPKFQPMYDELWMLEERSLPVVMVSHAVFRSASSHRPSDLLRHAANLGPVAHVPLLLASLPEELPEMIPSKSAEIQSLDPRSIQVVIQTRDEPILLEACVRTLVETASSPNILDIVIVDNRSELPETLSLLEDLGQRYGVRSIRLDEDFNWSKANNIAVDIGTAETILFLNNDVEMLSHRWDVRLNQLLSRPRAGAVGASLLYPSGEIQHGGIIFGMNNGHPIHEGIWQKMDADAPGRRWTRTRLTAATTGAWLGTTRKNFETIRGFDEELPLSYNDVDFCLRLRSNHKSIILAGDIVAIHHESATRGLSFGSEQASRDAQHFQRLAIRWGDCLIVDPAYNPNWVRDGIPFDGLRIYHESELWRWIGQSKSRFPWAVSPERHIDFPWSIELNADIESSG